MKSKLLLTVLTCCSMFSCEDFLEIEAPDHKMISEVVFDSDEMASSAMKGIYNELFNAAFSGGFNSVTVVAGLSGDDLAPIKANSFVDLQFDEHEILPDNSRVLRIWSSAYNIIYLCNSLLEGIENSNNISNEIYNEIKGEASFVRAFTYFYLVNIFGEVPLILTTNYKENSLATNSVTSDIYNQVLTDLKTAETLLENYSGGERTKINRFVSIALSARVNLYLENWEEAERLSSEVLSQTGSYMLLDDINQVFLANSKEAIWQLSPEGRGTNSTHTNEGSVLIINPELSFLANIKMEPDFVATFESDDKRLRNWVGFDENLNVHFAYKYKIWNSSSLPIEEYSMVIRLAELYLIRAESRAKMGDLNGAIADINMIRNRSNLDPIPESNSLTSVEQVFDLIIEERKRELFAEWGHRWLDLKRTGKAKAVFSDNPTWQDTDALYPIPEAELMKTPNLRQNPNY